MTAAESARKHRLDQILEATRKRRPYGTRMFRKALLEQPYLTVREAAFVVGRSRSTIREWIRRRELANVGWGRHFLVVTQDLLRVAEQYHRYKG